MGDVVGHRLLVRHCEHQRAVVAVAQPKQLRDLDAARPAPGILRLQHRHQHLEAADSVHLLANDLLGTTVNAPAGG